MDCQIIAEFGGNVETRFKKSQEISQDYNGKQNLLGFHC